MEKPDSSQAASDAYHELLEHLDDWTAKDVIAWMKKWYTLAGYRRLGKVLVSLGEDEERSS